MATFLRLVLIAAVLLGGVSQSANANTRGAIALASAPLTQFTTEASAKAHCPRDAVVWLNTNSGIYHYKGERWYGRTKHGAYVCEKEAIAAGDRASENGQ
jgi:hypothetical protein